MRIYGYFIALFREKCLLDFFAQSCYNEAFTWDNWRMVTSYKKRTIQLYWQHIRPHKWSGLSLFFCVTAGSLIGMTIPLYYKRLFDALALGTGSPGVFDTLIAVLVMIGLLNIVEWFLWRGAAMSNNIFHPNVVRDLSNYCFAYMHKHSFNFFQSNFVGFLVKRVNQFVGGFENLADNIFWYLIRLVINITFALIVLFDRSILLGGSIVAWIILFLIVNWFLTSYKYKYDLERGEAEAIVSRLLADTITNHGNVKLFNGYAREVGAFATATEKVRKLRTFTWNLDTAFDAIQAALMIVLEVGIFYAAIRLWQEDALSIGDFVLLQAYLLTIFDQIWSFGRTIRNMVERLAEAEEMTVILDTPHEIEDVADAYDLHVAEGRIEFRDVDFNYNQTRKVVDGLNMDIKPKEKVAIVGSSGAGKTTLIKLLMRIHDVSAGKILIDGQKIVRVTLESLWRNVSLVPQEPILFHRSLMENIRYGKPEATDDEVIAAAKLAHCHEFIMSFSEKYDTMVGERGVKLSGGERQRVAIARAILRDAPILVLDEATSSLDSESERLIQDALENLMKGKTVIVIAHRLSTIMKMDRIIVMHKGKIIEDDTHAGLLERKDGTYRKLWGLQAGGFIAQ